MRRCFTHGSTQTESPTKQASDARRGAATPQPALCEPRRTLLESLEARFVLTAPTLAAISDVTLLAGAPLHIALDGFDFNGDTLTYTATSTSSALTAGVPTGNRSVKMNVNGFGDMVFELFEDLAPRTTSRMIQLAGSHFYDNTIFHRIINDFVIQGGDPTGTGSGGSQLGKFDDEFNALLQHTSTGLLSMAKTTDDTNDSQFFITEGPQRHLDFQHSIFGFLTSGESVRQAISNVATSSSRPITDVKINSTTVFLDNEDGVLRLSAPEGTTGQADVTVTVSDGNGGTAQRTFHVTIVPDPTNNNPFLQAIAAVQSQVNTPVTFQLPAIEVEGNSIFYLDRAKLLQYGVNAPTQNANLQVNVNFNTGQVTVTPSGGITGTFPIYVGVSSLADPATVASAAARAATVDFQTINVTINAQHQAPVLAAIANETIMLGETLSKTVTASDGDPGDILTYSLTGNVPAGATINASTGAISFTPTAAQAATPQTISVRVTDSFGLTDTKSFQLTVKAPPALGALPSQQASEGQAFSLVVSASDPNTGDPLTFALDPGVPTGLTFDPASRTIHWTPNESQGGGTYSVTVRVTDSTGLFDTETFSIQVAEISNAPVLGAIGNRQVVEEELLQFTVTATDSDSTSLTFSLESGAPAGATINPQTGVFTWTPTAAQAPGTYQITIRASDDGGQSDTETISVTVIDVNEAPLLVAIGSKSVAEGAALTFTVTATDPNAPHETLRYSLDNSAPAGASIDPNTGTFRWTPGEAQGPGSYSITIRVIDSRGLSDTKTVDIAVAEIDQSPVIAPIDDQFAVGGQQLEVQVSAFDPDAPAQAIIYTLVSGPTGATVDANTGVFRWTPAENVAGRFTVTIRASEVSGASATVSFGVTAGLDAFGIMLTSRLNLPQLIDDALPAQVQSFAPFDISPNSTPAALQLRTESEQRFAAVEGLDRIQASGEIEELVEELQDDQVKPATGVEPVDGDFNVPSNSRSQPGESSGEAILELLDAAVRDLFGAQGSGEQHDWLTEASVQF